MTLKTPPAWTQGGTYTAQSDRLTAQGVISGTGILGSSSLAVTAQASPNMTVNIASGWAAIQSSTSNNGIYQIFNDATVVATITTADATNPRIDRVVATVTDGSNTVAFSVIAGTPAASPSAPATPNDSISLATVAVAAATTTITSGNITDTRVAAPSNFVTGIALPLAGGTMTGALTLTPSTASVAPLKLQSSATFLSSPTGGVFEYDSNSAYFTPNGSGTSGHANLRSTFFYGLGSADRSLLSGGSATSYQSFFGVGLPLAASTTYEIEISGRLTVTQSATATAYNINLAFSSSPTSLSGNGLSAGPTAATLMNVLTTGAFTAYTSAASALTFTVPFVVKALVRTNAATTFTPQVQASTSATTAMSAGLGSFVKVTPVGNATVTNVGAWA